MKLNIKKKGVLKPRLYGSNSSSPASSGSMPDWMLTDESSKRKAVNKAKTQQQFGPRLPEIWWKDGESKMVRFRYPEEVAMIWVYKVKLRNGKFTRITAPGRHSADLFRDELGLKPSLVAIYELIDIQGYKNREGKRVKNQPKFWVVSYKVHEQLKKIAEKRGGLHRMDIDISRTGSDATTTYTMLPEVPTPMTAEQKSAEKLTPQIAKLFAPPTEKEQRAILPSIAVKRDEDDD